jgi:hypothetical protein
MTDSMKVVISGGFLLVSGFLHMSRVPTGERIMAAWRRAIELSLGDSDTAKLRSIAQSRTEPASRVERGGYCWPIGKTRRFLRSVGRWGCTIKRAMETGHHQI